MTSHEAVAAPASRDEVSALFSFFNVLLRRKRWIFAGMLVGAIAAVGWKLSRPTVYVSNAIFIPQGTSEVQRSGLAALAGQFGVGIGGPSGTQSPKFYTDLFSSYDFLLPIAQDTFAVTELGGARKTLAELYNITEKSPVVRAEAVVSLLSGLITSTTDGKTGAITFFVTTEWPSVSYAIAQRVLVRLNDYNLRLRQSQASGDRRFIAHMLAQSRDSLRQAEEQLKDFLQSNREWSRSPELTFRHGQLERNVNAAEQMVMSMTQSHADALVREARDTPVISVIEPPRLPFGPQRKRLTSRAILGLLVGAMVVSLGILTQEFLAGRRRSSDPAIEEFMAHLKLWGSRRRAQQP